MLRYQRALVGLLTAGALSVPAFTVAVAAQNKPAPKKPPAAKGDAKAGKGAFQSEGCTGCHKTKEYAKDGGQVGPDLAAVGKEKKPAEIEAYIKKPKKDSVMPASKAPPKILADLVAYLSTQK